MFPSPNVQFHDVGPFVERSVNVTLSGAVPEVGVPTKLATGGFAEEGANFSI
jgi:hypothetical protein